jgi:hypothetical protein
MEKKVSKEQMATLPYIIAVDFDGTLVEDRFPEIGEPREEVWTDLRNAQKNGAKIILYTSRDHERLKEAVAFCNSRNFHFDAINENLDECKVLFDNDTRKVYADEYWDDKAVRKYCSKSLSLLRSQGYECEGSVDA